MSFLGKTYTLEKNENFSEFLGSLGIPAEKVEALLQSKPSQKVQKEGDSYVLTTVDPRGTKDLKFQSGVEFEEDVSDGIIAKTTFNVNEGGNVVDQVQKFADGRTLTVKREFSGSELTVSLTVTGWDGTARRYYKA